MSWVTHKISRAHTHTVWLLIVLVWAGIPLDSISLKTLTDLLCACVCVCVSPGLLNKSGVSVLEKRRQHVIVLTDVSTLPLSLSLSFFFHSFD